MRVLAAVFADAATAQRALEELGRRFTPKPGDVSIAPLGSADHPAPAVVLAGRFAEDVIPDIRAVLTARAGEIVSDVDERWTRSAAPTPAEFPSSASDVHPSVQDGDALGGRP
jgi:hypothetical protein